MSTIGPKIVLEGEKEYRKAIYDINREQRVLTSEMRKVSAEFDGNANSIGALNKKNDVLVKDYDKQEERIKTLRGALENAGKVYGENSKEVQNWQIKLNNAEAKLSTLDKELQENEKHLDEAKKSTDGTADSIDEYGKEVKEAEKDTSRFGDVLKANLASDLIIKGVKALGNSVKSLAKSSLGVGMDFESSMSLVAATMGITTDEIDAGSEAFVALSDAAKKAGAETKYNSAEGAEALNYLALAGYSVEKSVAALPTVLNLASSGGLDLAYASDLVTDSMSALGMETDELDSFVDQLAKTSQKSNTNIAQLGEGILTVGGTAKIMAGGTTELSAQLGILADNGIKGAEGGTALRNVLLALSAPTKKQSDQMKALGINTYDANGQLRPTNEIFNDINGVLSNMTQQGQTEVLSKLFNKVDLKAANAMLANSGDRFNDLSGEIANADGAAGEMAKTMEHNLKGQIEEFDSAAEAVGITVYEKFEIPLRDAVKAGTSGLGSLNRELESGGLGGSVESMGQKFGELSANAIELGLDALPTVINGLGWLIDNGPIIIGTIGGILTGLVAFKVGGAIIKGIGIINGLWGLYKTATEGAALSQAALNAVQMVSPMGLLAGAIGLAVGAFVAYKLSAGSAKSETDKLTEEINKNIEANKEFNEEVKNGAQERKDKTRDIQAEYEASKKLSKELYALADKENKTNAEKRRMSVIVGELNEAIPELNLSIDEETGLLNIQRKELDSLIDTKLEYAKVQAAQEDLVRIAKDQYEAEKNLWIAQDDRSRIQEELSKKEAERAELTKQGIYGISEETRNRAEKVRILGEEIESLKGLEGENNDVMATSEERLESLGKEFDQTSGFIDDFSEANEESAESVTMASQETVDALKLMQEEYELALSATAEKIYDSMGLFDEFAKNTELSGEQLLKNLQGQVTGMREWSKNLQELSKKGIEEGLLQELYDMGPKAAGEVQALNKMTNEELEEYNKAWREKTGLASEIAGQQTQDMMDDIEAELATMSPTTRQAVMDAISAGSGGASGSDKVGEELVNGMTTGVNRKSWSLSSAVKNVAQSAIEAAKKKLGIRSPSKVFEEIGGYTAEGFEVGFIDKMASVNKELSASLPSDVDVNTPNLNAETQVSSTNDIAGVISELANRPIVLSINGREFAKATAEDMSAALNNVLFGHKRGLGGLT